MKMTTRGLPIIGDTTNLSWVGRNDYEQMLEEYGVNPTRKKHGNTFEARHYNPNHQAVCLFTTGGHEENNYKMLFLHMILDLAIKGHWLKGWSKDVVYPITNQPNESEVSYVYPEHLRKDDE
jgi:hypothetical protein